MPRVVGLLLLGAVIAFLLSGLASADGDAGRVRGVITIVGESQITDGEVVVSFAGTNSTAATALFSTAQPGFDLGLDPGEYTVYAWAKVYHNSPRTSFTVEANATTWVNLTVVRIEEIIGTVADADANPLGGAVMQFLQNGTILGTSTSDDQGRFRDLLDPGTYTMRVTKSGYQGKEMEVTVTEGQVLELDVTMEPVPVDDEGEPVPWMALVMTLFVFLALGGSIGYMMRQARRVRVAALEAEASRSRAMLCPECGAKMSEGTVRCPECSHVLQVRCDECGRAMDAGTPECPECGAAIR